MTGTAARHALLSRPDLEDRLDETFDKRLTLLVAGAGYGKSTLLTQWTADLRSAWYTATSRDHVVSAFAAGLGECLQAAVGTQRLAPSSGVVEADAASAEMLASAVLSSLDEVPAHDIVLVIDDAHQLSASPSSVRLVESLCRQAPSTVHVVLATREPLALRIERLRGQGAVLELTGSDLAFGQNDVAGLWSALVGDDTSLSAELHAVTAGWPAAVRLALEALRHQDPVDRAAAIASLREPGSPLFDYLAQEVFGREPPETMELVRRVAVLDRFTAPLCAALGLEHAQDSLERLRRRGLFVLEHGRWYALHALVRDFARNAWPLTEAEHADVLGAAAAWFEASELYEDALSYHEAAGRFDDVRRLLEQRGDELLERGAGETIVRVVQALPAALRDADMGLLLGDALVQAGDSAGAVERFEAAAGQAEQLEARIAWRLMRALHLDGNHNAARDVWTRAVADSGDLRDRAQVHAWGATAAGIVGAVEDARSLAAEAVGLATESNDDVALADAHTAAGLVADREGRALERDSHYAAALAAAERARDSHRGARVRANIGSTLMDRGSYRAAIDEFDRIIEGSEPVLPSYFRHALGNRGVASWMLGYLDEALADYTELLALSEDDPIRRAFGVIGTADVHRARGNAELARAHYVDGLAGAEQGGHETLIVIALCGLARSLVDAEPARAEELADRAGVLTTSEHAWTSNARGWVALAHGHAETAAELAAEALEEARRRGFAYEIGEAMELAALAAPGEPGADARLEEALAVWTELGNRDHTALVELALSRMRAEPASHALGLRAERRLRAYGVRLSPLAPAGIARMLAPATPAPLAVQTLGGFMVVRDGSALGEADWQSRKSRDILKILVARRGRATPRELLMDALWPDEAPDRLANRLSVALSTLRTVLDPEKRRGPEAFVGANRESVFLQPGLLVDVEVFLREAQEGLALRTAGAAEEARDRLESAESMYRGDFLDEDPYADWAVSLREEARAAYIGVGHALAEDALARGDPSSAARSYLRILGYDGYDERAHLGLVSALALNGRHGEARRTYRAYVGRMEEIGVTPAAFADVAAHPRS